MTNIEKIAQLRAEIDRVIKPLITGDCHLTNLPYHTNIGDALIWNGSRAFLKGCGSKLLSETSEHTWKDSRVKPNDIIIFNGGGNIGDIWRTNMEFFLRVVNRHHSNRIILLPNSAWYKDETLLLSDANILSKHPDLHLIARDKYSYGLMKEYFGINNIYLAPDMAFYIPDSMLQKVRQIVPIENSVLYLRRIDKEFVPETSIEILGATISDWPTMSNPSYIDKWYPHLNRTLRSINYKTLIDLVGHRCVRNRNVKIGAKFIAEYEQIVTTRLHTLILSVLIGRPVQYIDNISKKLSSFVDTWLSELNTVRQYPV